jgi:hypothetical protein
MVSTNEQPLIWLGQTAALVGDLRAEHRVPHDMHAGATSRLRHQVRLVAVGRPEVSGDRDGPGAQQRPTTYVERPAPSDAAPSQERDVRHCELDRAWTEAPRAEYQPPA